MDSQNIQIEQVAVGDLKPAAYNPREIAPHEMDLLRRSIQQYGFVDPVIVNRDGTVIGGHQRLAAAKFLGMATVPCVRLDLEPKKEKALNLALNAIGGDFVMADVAGMLREMQDVDLVTGFDVGEVLAAHPEPGEESVEEGAAAYPIFDREKIIDIAAEEYFQRGNIEYREREFTACGMQLVNKAAAMTLEKLRTSNRLSGFVNSYHPAMLAVPVDRKRTVLEAWQEKRHVRKAVEKTVDIELMNRASTLHFMHIVHSAQVVSNYRPEYAAYLYRIHGDGPGVFDPCMGWGGRMVGFLVSRMAGQYITCEPNVDTFKNNMDVADALEMRPLVQAFNLPVEDALPCLPEDACGMAFTCPPYFVKERYSEADTDCTARYPEYPRWLDGFLRPMLQSCVRVTRPKTRTLITIADIEIGTKQYPLVADTKRIAEEVGLHWIGDEQYPMSFGSRGDMDDKRTVEPILIFENRK